MIDIIRGSEDKPAVSQRLIDYFKDKDDINGSLYLGYPIIGTFEGTVDIDAMLVSEKFGIVAFDLIETKEFEERIEFHYDVINNLTAKFLLYKKLRKKRDLMVNINMITFAPRWESRECDFDLAINEKQISSYLENFEWENSDYYNKLVEAIQAITTIKSTPKRNNLKKNNSRGAKLKRLEDSIANLDSQQSKAVIETSKNVQRIRGLAGSGKTIVLALKVAYLHAKNPDWNIAVTFNTRSLKGQFRELINRFVFEHKREEPDWGKVNIIHAWGSPYSEGIYYNFCKYHGVEYFDFSTAKNKSGSHDKAFSFACKQALEQSDKFNTMYDVILVDEAQDFSKYFLRLCYKILGKRKRLIFAYDELQSLNEESMESPEEIFGINKNGNPNVKLRNRENKPKEDIILKKCYRNSRPLLSTAHALGFGIYHPQGLIQLFDEPSLWKDIGYKIFEGSLKGENNVSLGRTGETSPTFLEDHSSIDDLISFKKFDNKEQQTDWLVNEIENNIKNDELEYKDIMVIHTNPKTTRTDIGDIRNKLFDLKIKSHLAGVNTSPDEFFMKNSITFTSIYRAKGNEAAMVYVIDSHNCYEGSELAKKRNILFTAITRSKAWVRVTGYGDGMKLLTEEFNKIVSNNFKLNFKYPTEEEREKMNIIHRDKTQDERRKIINSINNLSELNKLIEQGEIYKEDLPESILESLKDWLNNE